MLEPVEYLSEERLAEIKAELQKLKTEDIAEVAERVAHARSLGDLRENAEYHKAKDDQAWLFSRISDLEGILKRASVVKKGNTDVVSMGSRIELLKSGAEEKIVYVIVSQAEANIEEGKLSNTSPLGAVLIGKREGENVTLETSKGKNVYKIVSIT